MPEPTSIEIAAAYVLAEVDDDGGWLVEVHEPFWLVEPWEGQNQEALA